MNHKIGQLIMVGLKGPIISEEEKKFIVENNISGVTLFARNLESPKQIHELCSDIQNLRHQMPDKAPLLIGVDMEGGRVARLKPPFTQWPPAKKIGELDSSSMTFKFSLSMGAELKAVGINLNFAPCADTLTNPTNEIIGDRAISPDPELVAKHASALIRGFIKANIIPCVKHFPGHGNTLVDSHFELPVESTDLGTLLKRECIPFKKSFRSRVDFVMTSHIMFKNIDPDWPVTLSKKFLKEILRESLGFKQLVVTDDLGMKALADNYDPKVIPVQALNAGCDLLLYCNEFDTPPLALEAINKALTDKKLDALGVDNSYKKILNMKKDKISNPDPIKWSEAEKLIGHSEHQEVAGCFEQGVISPTMSAS